MTPRSYLMIRPCGFGYNPQTAVNNTFQTHVPQAGVQQAALKEFDAYVDLLRQHQIEVLVVDDTPDPPTPDSIFPNNWISFHPNGLAILYPMFAPNRRLERKKAVFDAILAHSPRQRWIDMSLRERTQTYLEGTGSMIFDREQQCAYACLSPRTNKELFEEVCQTLGYRPFVFHAEAAGQPIYHTNVMMAMGREYVVICWESIPDAAERAALEAQFQATGKEVVPITLDQMNHFAGNMFQVFSTSGDPYLVLSQQAFDALTPMQRARLQQYNPLLTPSLTTIETNGGGSARCMIAEIV